MFGNKRVDPRKEIKELKNQLQYVVEVSCRLIYQRMSGVHISALLKS